MADAGWHFVYLVGVVAVVAIITFIALLILIILAGLIKDAFKTFVLGHKSTRNKESHGQDA